MRYELRKKILDMIQCQIMGLRADYIYKMQKQIYELEGAVECLKGKHSPKIELDKNNQVVCSRCSQALGTLITQPTKEHL